MGNFQSHNSNQAYISKHISLRSNHSRTGILGAFCLLGCTSNHLHWRLPLNVCCTLHSTLKLKIGDALYKKCQGYFRGWYPEKPQSKWSYVKCQYYFRVFERRGVSLMSNLREIMRFSSWPLSIGLALCPPKGPGRGGEFSLQVYMCFMGLRRAHNPGGCCSGPFYK